MTIREYLKTNKLLTDGAMGTYYSSLSNDTLVSEIATHTKRELIKRIHREYLEAGAMLLRTNTFAVNTKALSITKEEQIHFIQDSVKLAKETIQDFIKGKDTAIPFLAGSIGPILELIEEKEEDILKEYYLIADTLLESGVDAILFETFPNEKYPIRAAEYIREKNKDLFIMAEVSLSRNGYTETGVSAARILERFANCNAIDACGFNCGIGSGHMISIMKGLKFPKNKYIMITPNAGYPEQMQNRMVFMNNALYFAENLKKIADQGADIIGACCGSTPEYIRAVHHTIDLKRNETKEIFVREVLERRETASALQKETNSFYQMLSANKKVIACELDPPYDGTDEKILAAAETLKACNADIITLADSPMGRSRIDSILMASKIHNVTGMPVMPHVCCRDRNMIAMRSSLLGAYINDIRNLLLVTGDPVPQNERLQTTGVFDYHSIKLMNYVKEMNQEHFSKEPFVYGGALNYNLNNIDKIIERMEQKIEAGADYFLTQPIYSKEDIERIALLKRRVSTKILCGIMPLTSYSNATFIKNEITGIHIPQEIVDRYKKEMTKEEAEYVGAEIASEIIEKLSDIADGYYIMLQFNRASFMEKIRIK